MTESLIHVNTPTDLVMLLMQFTDAAPWNLPTPLMINDDFCDVTVRTPDGDVAAECGGYVAFVTLEQFQRVVADNGVIDGGGQSVCDDLESNLEDNAVYVLPGFVGEIKGTTAGWHDDWSIPYVISFPPNTKIEPVEQTKQRLSARHH